MPATAAGQPRFEVELSDRVPQNVCHQTALNPNLVRESALDPLEEIQAYCGAGNKAVWAFYPNLRVIAAYDQSGVRELRREQVLETPELLPGFQATTNQCFAVKSKP
jgi:hypothetical protein